MLFRAKYHQRLSAFGIESLICLNSVGGYYTEHRLAYGQEAGKDQDRCCTYRTFHGTCEHAYHPWH
jgi:hypothetical protein